MWQTDKKHLKKEKLEHLNGVWLKIGLSAKTPWKLLKKQCDQVEARGKQIYFSPATWGDHLSNFLVFILFQPNAVIYH